jgi:hypothetical protein
MVVHPSSMRASAWSPPMRLSPAVVAQPVLEPRCKAQGPHEWPLLSPIAVDDHTRHSAPLRGRPRRAATAAPRGAAPPAACSPPRSAPSPRALPPRPAAPSRVSISVQSVRSCSSCVTIATARHARVNTLPPPPPRHVSATARARASASLALGRTKRRSSRAPCQCAVSYASGVRVAVRVKRRALAAESAPPVRAGGPPCGCT